MARYTARFQPLAGQLVTARIYVQIPAYRDRELLPTLSDLMRTASQAERLRVAVAACPGPFASDP